MEPHAPSPRPAGRRTCSEQEWAWAKADYLDGFAAPQIAAAYGMGVSTLRERAQREGWRRQDQPPAESGLGAGEDDLTDEDQDVATMVQTAWRRAALAIKTGDRLAARAWLRLHEDLLPILRETDEITRDVLPPAPSTPDARAAPDALDALDGLDGENLPSAAGEPDAPRGPTPCPAPLKPGALDRADRRLRAQVWKLKAGAANGALTAAEAEARIAALLTAPDDRPRPP